MEQGTHTHQRLERSGWPTGFGTNSHSLLLNQPLLPSQWVPVIFSTYLLTQYM